MRAITVRQPWAWSLVHGGKDVENRVRNIAGDYRGPIAVHAGLQFADMPDGMPREVACAVGEWSHANPGAQRVDLPNEPKNARPIWYGNLGNFIGIVNLWAVHEARAQCCPKRDPGPFGSKWAMADHWHLCVNNPRPLVRPIPAKGRLGLWRVSDDLAAQIDAATPVSETAA